MLNWANRFNICAFLDNHQYDTGYQAVECLVAAGCVQSFSANDASLDALSRFIGTNPDWIFGHINYDFKNKIERLRSDHPDRIGFPEVCFFIPETVLKLGRDRLHIYSLSANPVSIYQEITNAGVLPGKQVSGIRVRPRITREEYISAIKNIRQHIVRGDCYELNFCQEFFADNTSVNPLQVYRQLTSVSPNPFSCYYKVDDKYLLCASPERYLQKKGSKILSQPIKGTFKRDRANPALDEQLKQQLRNSEKDKSENVMVVDLVRNDISRICRKGSVTVDELFGIYSFPQVHQMISTISGELEEGIDFTAIIKATFPMGSMTGAPKKRVMELIEKYESTKRGIYSGAVGYIEPGGDFDFNVVIRSILYNATDRYLSYLVGGGITFYSDPEKEYEECLLKAEAMQAALR